MPNAYLELIPKEARDILKQALAKYPEDEVIAQIARANMSGIDINRGLPHKSTRFTLPTYLFVAKW